MATSKLANGPQVTFDKTGRKLYWIDRKRVKESVYLAELSLLANEPLVVKLEPQQLKLEPQLPKLPPASTDSSPESILDQLDALLLEVRRHFQPTTTDKERTLLALCQMQDSGYYAGYAEALAVAGSPMAANALIGSLQRKGLIRYESKEEARYRLISTEGRYFQLTSTEVQNARIIEPTSIGAQLGDAHLKTELTSI
jgi:hypothetical protein